MLRPQYATICHSMPATPLPAVAIALLHTPSPLLVRTPSTSLNTGQPISSVPGQAWAACPSALPKHGWLTSNAFLSLTVTCPPSYSVSPVRHTSRMLSMEAAPALLDMARRAPSSSAAHASPRRSTLGPASRRAHSWRWGGGGRGGEEGGEARQQEEEEEEQQEEDGRGMGVGASECKNGGCMECTLAGEGGAGARAQG
jgi:hypothetical protein